MILIFGGIYQGKLSYALDKFNLTEEDVYRCHEEEPASPKGNKIIYELDKWLLALTRESIDAGEALKSFIDDNKNAIVIVNDISCGVVPVDETQRKWREAVGRSLSELSRISEETIRLFCGIPTKIK